MRVAPFYVLICSYLMAVYTQVSESQTQPLLETLGLGELQALSAIKGGIENTNYFLSTTKGEFVLTLFERLSHGQLPFYLHLMKHLAQKGITVPEPLTSPGGEIIFTLNDKPAAVVTRLLGQSQLTPSTKHCEMVGAMLARMHLAGKDFHLEQPNLRGLPWWNETVPQVLPYLNQTQHDFLTSELAYQNHISSQSSYTALPRGPVHADLFRDNVMFNGDALSGFFDFYFAGVDTWLFDLSVCLNDWCIDLKNGAWNPDLLHAFLNAYQSIRALEHSERALLNAMLRAAAFRFWLSRIWDFHLPRKASLLQPHDPTHFERVLYQRVNSPLHLH